MKQFDRVRGTYDPLRTDDLAGYAVPEIGERWTWEALWIIEDGLYAGQWAMRPVDAEPAFAWAPFCDLSNVEAA